MSFGRSKRLRRLGTVVGAALVLATTPGARVAPPASAAGPPPPAEARTAPQLVARTGHSGFPTGGHFSADGRLIVTYDFNTAILWTREGEEIRQIPCDAWRATLSPSAKYLASIKGSKVVVYSTETGEVLHEIALGEDVYAAGAVFMADEQSVATLTVDTVSVWDLKSGKVLRSFKCTSAIATGLVISPAGDVLVTYGGGRFAQTSLDSEFAFQDKSIRLWDPGTGKLLQELRGHNETVNDVAFSRDGKLLASAGADGRIWLWDVASGDAITRLKPHGDMPDAGAVPLPPVRSLDLSPDGKSVLSVSGGDYSGASMRFQSPTFVRIWNVETGEAETIKTYPWFASWGSHAAYSPDGKQLLLTAGEIQVVDLATRKPAITLNGLATVYGDIAFTKDGQGIVATGSALTRGGYEENVRVAARHASIWDLGTGAEAKRIRVPQSRVHTANPAFSRSGTFLAVAATDRTPDGKKVTRSVKLYDPQTLRELWSAEDTYGTLFSPDEKHLLVARGTDGKHVELCEAQTGKTIVEFSKGREFNGEVIFSDDSRYLATLPYARRFGLEQEALTIWDAASGARVSEISLRNRSISAFAISPDSKTVAIGVGWTLKPSSLFRGNIYSEPDKNIRLYDLASGKEIRAIPLDTYSSFVCAFSPDGKQLLVNGADTASITVVDIESGAVVRTLKGHRGEVIDVAFSPDGQRLATSSQDGTIRLWDAKTGVEICQIISFVDGTWLIARPDGRFDTNGLESADGLRWVLPDDPMRPVPFEIFMRDYYEPRLLTRLLAGETFDPVESVASRNRTQPRVAISRVYRSPDRPDTVSVSVEVESVAGAAAAGQPPSESGVFDVRLFRDGQLVGYAPAGGGRVEVDPATRKRTVTFDNVRLPRNAGARQVALSAYAFNQDHVKSATDVKSFQVPADVTPMKGRAYVVAIGVNANERKELSLRFAARDATTLSDALASRLARTGAYEEIVPVTLVSDYDPASADRTATKRDATKANIKAVLDALAGRPPDRSVLDAIPGAAGLRKVGPEDTVVIAFAGHGYAGPNGSFLLVPYDTGPQAGTENGLGVLPARCISSDELTAWLRDVDANEMVMIIDACQSAASIEAGGFKPGPMGSRGLGQLAYDKGMRILAASQADNFALESTKLQHGLLTYALVHDGLEGVLADNRPRDGVIQLSEWLAFGVTRVPELCEEIRQGRTRAIILDSDESPQRAATRVQRPQLFDFTRVRKDVVLAQGLK
jgi:WD40 repeat protein/uncharacterized caspase-like protein